MAPLLFALFLLMLPAVSAAPSGIVPLDAPVLTEPLVNGPVTGGPVATAPVTADGAVPPAIKRGPVRLEIFEDTSGSGADPARLGRDTALVTALVSSLRADDEAALWTFSSTVEARVPAAPAHSIDVAAALGGLTFDGIATFYAPIYLQLAETAAHKLAEAPPTDGGPGSHLARVAVIISDVDASDALNAPADWGSRVRTRPDIADPSWASPKPSILADIAVLWVVRDQVAKPSTRAAGKQGVKATATTGPVELPVVAGAVQARWTEPSGLESTLVNWAPDARWAPGDISLMSWVDAARPEVLAELATEPGTGWAGLALGAARWVGMALGTVLLGGGLIFSVRVGLRRMGAVAESAVGSIQEGLVERQRARMLEETAATEVMLRLEPADGLADAFERSVRAGSEIQVGPTADPRGFPIALPTAGFILRFDARLDRAALIARGTRPGLSIRRREHILPIGREPLLVGDGDVVIDSSDRSLLTIRLRGSRPGARRSA